MQCFLLLSAKKILVYVETSHVLQLDNFLSFTRVKAKIKKVRNEKPAPLHPKKINPPAGRMQMF